MTRHEQLHEQYEDALFALLMDEVATQEGKKAMEENKQLLDDPSAAVPEAAVQRCIRTIRRRFARQNARAARRAVAKVLNKAAIVALVAVALFVGVFAVSPEFRAHTLNLMIEVFDEGTTFRFSSGAAPSSENNADLTATWLPEGFELKAYEKDTNIVQAAYQNDSKDYISIVKMQGSSGALTVDTEDADARQIPIQGQDALLIQKNGECKITWAVSEQKYFVSITATGVVQDDLIRVAEQLVIK